MAQGSLKNVLRATGCEVGSYLDDLYVVRTALAEEIVARFEAERGSKVARKPYVDRFTGKSWLEIPGILAAAPDDPQRPVPR